MSGRVTGRSSLRGLGLPVTKTARYLRRRLGVAWCNDLRGTLPSRLFIPRASRAPGTEVPCASGNQLRLMSCIPVLSQLSWSSQSARYATDFERLGTRVGPSGHDAGAAPTPIAIGECKSALENDTVVFTSCCGDHVNPGDWT
jgi:hypothetical protein